MTALASPPTTDLALHAPPATAGFTYDQLERMAKSVADSKLFACQSPAQAMTLMLLAQAEGLHPIQAMRQYHIIQNRPSMRADAIQARFEADGGRIKFVERTKEACEAVFTHPDVEQAETIRWTLADAQDAKLTGNEMWKKYPRQMLHARVISEGVRTVRPGIIVGLYTPEEVEDMDQPREPRKRPPTTTVAPAAAAGDAAPAGEQRQAVEGEEVPDYSDDAAFHDAWYEAAAGAGWARDEAERKLADTLTVNKITLDRLGPGRRGEMVAKMAAGGYDGYRDALRAKAKADAQPAKAPQQQHGGEAATSDPKPAEAKAGPVTAPAGDRAALEADVETWALFVANARAAAGDAVDDTTFDGAINRALLMAGKKGKGDTTSKAWRAERLEAIRAGAFNWETSSINKVAAALG